jgi:peptidyl-prolyl cis-trans isomerase D
LRVYFEQRRLLEQMYQERLNPNVLRLLPEQIFRELVETRLLSLEARRLGVEIGDGAVAHAITSNPNFLIDGRFDPKEYRRRLELQRIPVEDYEAQTRAYLLGERVRSLITAGVSVTPAEVEREFRRRNERVRAEYVLVGAKRFQTEVKVADKDVARWLSEHKEAYRIPEKRVVEYVLLGRKNLQSQIPIGERDIDHYLEQNEDDFREEEQVCARHILVKVAADGEGQGGHREGEASKTAAQVVGGSRQCVARWGSRLLQTRKHGARVFNRSL